MIIAFYYLLIFLGFFRRQILWIYFYNLQAISNVNYQLRIIIECLIKFLQDYPLQALDSQAAEAENLLPPVLQDLHQQILPYMLTVTINVGIFLAMYKYKRYTIFGHFIIGFAVAFITLLFTFPVLLKTTIPSAASKSKTHQIIGYVVVCAIFLQVVLGCLCKLLNLCKVPSVVLYYMNKAHTILGYSMTILCKFQVYNFINQDHVFWILIAQDCLFFVMTIIRKIFFPNLQSTIVPQNIKSDQVKKITSLNQLKNYSKNGQQDQKIQEEQKEFCSFANYVYDLEGIKLTHPAGYEVVESVKNREIDRFIYGMYRAQKIPNLPTNSHSFKSLDLLGQPIAIISIPSPLLNMPTQPIEVSISSINSISYNTRIYQVNLSSKQNLKFTGYESLQQLGRFYSLTVNKKVTRLYTSVNFLLQSNIVLLKKIGLGNLEYPDLHIPTNSSSKQVELIASTERALKFQQNTSDFIPLLIKVYEEGTLPNMLINHKAKSLILSPPRGFGLGLSQIQKGTILIIAGGTGLYPFSDLIDLLYKDYKISTSANLSTQIYRMNPILKQNPFSNFKFRLLFACQKVEDIHPITLKQINELSSSTKFSCCMRTKDPESIKKLKVNILNERFETVLSSEMSEIQDLVKVWACGPPKMNQSISKYFADKHPQKDILHFV